MSDNPQGVFIDDVEFPFDDSTSILEFSNKSLGEKLSQHFVMTTI